MAEAANKEPAAPEPQPPSLGAVALLFFRLGCTSFGGPAVHIAMMEDEAVRRRAWLSREKFLDLVAATNLIPGPNSTELAVHIGWLVAGLSGFLVAGLCFILPAVAIVSALAWAYVRFEALPEASGLLYGIKPVVIAVVVQALWRLARTSIQTKHVAVVAVLAGALNVLGVHELIVLVIGGVMVVVGRRGSQAGPLPCLAFLGGPIVPIANGALAGGMATGASIGLWSLFLFFLKVGSVLFGSGYVLLAFLRADLVERLEWLTEQQLLDAVAVGQVTPGPVFTTATFIGYVVAGPWGAAVATVGIFLPAFVFVALSVYLVPRLRRSPTAGAFLDGVIVASLALMAVVTWELGRTAIVDVPTALLAGISAVLLLRYRMNSAWLVLGGAAFGTLL